MGSGQGRAISRTRVGAPLARPELTSDEIALFCNILGVVPRHLTQCREAITARYDLGPRGAWIVGLVEVGVASPSALTKALQIGRSLLTAEINRLSQAGLIVTAVDGADGRRTVVSLTEDGLCAARELRTTVEGYITARLAGYTRREVLACLALLQDFVGGERIDRTKG